MSGAGGGHPPRARILLVEDEPALVLTLTDRLRAERYEVDAVSEGEGALAHSRGAATTWSFWT